MNWAALFHGGGKRRRSTENWDELERRLSDAEARTKHVKGARRYECAQHLHGPFWVLSEKPVACPWCEIIRLRGQLELVTMRPAPRPDTIAVAAPADQPTLLIARPVDEPAADVTAEKQPVDVRDLRAAMGENDTITLPVVAPATAVAPVAAPLDDTQMLVTWGANLPAKAEADTQQIRLPQIPDRPPTTDPVEAALNTPAPPPGAGASEISMAAGLAAVTKVHATVTAN